MINLAGRNDITHIMELIYGRYGNVENKSSATIRSELTSQNVISALGYTPVDSSAEITSAFDLDGELSDTD